MIRIQNIYYMLAYAFQVLREEGYRSVAAEEFEYAADLLAAILAKGVANQVRRGLYREYVTRTLAMSSPAGKINVSASVKENSLRKKQLVCECDEFIENAYLNRILKTTALLLIRCPEVAPERKEALRKTMFYFRKVEEINPRQIRWSRLSYHRNNATYMMLINICYLVIKGMLLTEQEGAMKLARYVDMQHLHRLFEKFVLAYYRKHYPQFHPSPSFIDWDVEGEETEYLPMMKADITLRSGDKTLIIDTKFYSRFLQANQLFDRRTWHSQHLYQIFAYVKNLDYTHSGKVSGLLLYAKTDEEMVPDRDYIINGNRISVRTVDLNADFPKICTQLNAIAEEFLLPG